MRELYHTPGGARIREDRSRTRVREAAFRARAATLDDLGRRLALAIVRPEVVALRRLLIAEAREFPALATEYFDRAPGQVLEALASGFEHLGHIGLLRVADGRQAAAQFAYLVAGEPLDRAVLVGTTPPRAHVIACAREGVQTFLARYEVSRGGRGRKG
jgi:TetR/AcrR family transcriptional regulator, mexJK operon transcriptional repressor